jgi:hypothetical protein
MSPASVRFIWPSVAGKSGVGGSISIVFPAAVEDGPCAHVTPDSGDNKPAAKIEMESRALARDRTKGRSVSDSPIRASGGITSLISWVRLSPLQIG